MHSWEKGLIYVVLLFTREMFQLLVKEKASFICEKYIFHNIDFNLSEKPYMCLFAKKYQQDCYIVFMFYYDIMHCSFIHLFYHLPCLLPTGFLTGGPCPWFITGVMWEHCILWCRLICNYRQYICIYCMHGKEYLYMKSASSQLYNYFNIQFQRVQRNVSSREVYTLSLLL